MKGVFSINIINKYKRHPLCSEHVLPVLSNHKMNSYQKEIARYVRHCSKSYTLSNGVPIESVSRMLGHLDLKTTQHYTKVVSTKISNDMKALRKKFKFA